MAYQDPLGIDQLMKKKKAQEQPQPVGTVAPLVPDKRTIAFNPDKTVTETVGDKATTLSQDEYAATLGRQGERRRIVSEKVKQLMELQLNENVKRLINKKREAGQSIELSDEDMARITGEAQVMQEQPLPSEAPLPAQAAAPLDESRFFPIDSIPQKLSDLNPRSKGERVATPKAFAEEAIITPTKKSVAKIYDFIYSMFHEGKGLEQKEAESTITDARAAISQDIQLVKLGLKDPQEIKLEIREYEAAIARLESSVQGLNKENLRYWQLDGKDVATQLIFAKQDIADYRALLDDAVLTGRANEQARATANYAQLAQEAAL